MTPAKPTEKKTVAKASAKPSEKTTTKPAVKKPTPVKHETFTADIIFYCKDCNKIVNASKAGRRYVYKCAECNAKNVAFGTEKSIRNFYHVKEEEKV